MFVHSDGEGDTGAKARLLAQFFQHFVEKWKLKAAVTLSDKDKSEIPALRTVFPDAKHQLCFWHVLRAIRTRLKILRRQPGPYDEKAANEEFSFIDREFIPVGQMTEEQVSSAGPRSPEWNNQLRRTYL